jgi:hypothetical protein
MLRAAHAAVRHAAGGVFGMAGDPRRDSDDLWAMRRHEPAYGVLAAAMALGVAQAFLPTAVDQSQYARLNAALITSAPIESGFVLTFAMLFFGWKWPRYGPLIFAPGLLLIAIGLYGDQALTRESFVLLGVPTVGLYLALLALIVAQSVLKRQDVASFILGCAVTIVLTCWIHDMLSLFEITPDRRIFVTRLSYSAMLVAIGAGLTWRFAARSIRSTALPAAWSPRCARPRTS